MPCRVGMTTRPQTREKEWQAVVTGFKNWRILERVDGRDEAQRLENHYAKQYGCKASGGGDDPDKPGDKWFVYRFEYTREI